MAALNIIDHYTQAKTYYVSKRGNDVIAAIVFSSGDNNIYITH